MLDCDGCCIWQDDSSLGDKTDSLHDNRSYVENVVVVVVGVVGVAVDVDVVVVVELMQANEVAHEVRLLLGLL